MQDFSTNEIKLMARNQELAEQVWILERRCLRWQALAVTLALALVAIAGGLLLASGV